MRKGLAQERMSGGPGFRTKPLDCGSVLLAPPLLVAAVGVTSVAPGGGGHTSSSLRQQKWLWEVRLNFQVKK